MQLDELVAAGVRAVVNLGDDDGADARAAVARPERIGQLDGEAFLAGAGDMAAQGGQLGEAPNSKPCE